MVFACCMAGPYHLDCGIPCQDAFAVQQGAGSIVCAAVADGLGSERFSDAGAQTAAQTAVAFCAAQLQPEMEPAAAQAVLQAAFSEAWAAVAARAAQEGNPLGEYDSTLCLAAYDGERLVFGQSGDSGLVALLESGDYVLVTDQQRDEEGNVFPLCFGPEKWVFGCVEAPVSGLMLLTDGLLAQICPPLLRGREIEINVPLARRFLDRFDCPEEDVPALEAAAKAYLAGFPRAAIDDDKTFVVCLNPQRPPKEKPADYYSAPDWDALRRETEEKLFHSSAPASAPETPPPSAPENAGPSRLDRLRALCARLRAECTGKKGESAT
ncbi:MAG: protein phosphatase 2C domain-containing protein [Candidatus Spyradocola sp.]|jgi:hypothetical protein